MNEIDQKISLVNDNVVTILSTWNNDKSTIYDKAQLLKELVDAIAEYCYVEKGKKYSKERIKFNIIVTNNVDLLKDIAVIEKNSTGREILIFEEDLQKKYEFSQIMTNFVAKLFSIVSKGMSKPNQYFILNDVKSLPNIDKELQRIYSSFDKNGNVKRTY